jgi:hypothetical protein
MIKYILAKNLTDGYRETFEISSVQIDNETHFISVWLKHISFDANKVPLVNVYQEFFNESVQTNILRVDPEWNTSSLPIAKPDNFLFENPTTWGDLCIEDIPMVSSPSLASKLIELRSNAITGTTFGEGFDKALLQFMLDKNVLPEGFTFISKEV